MSENGKHYDVLVVGAGHNGLTTAALLAKQGRKVFVLERAAAVGGLAVGDEFHPGYKSAGLLHDTSGVRPSVVDALQLQRHGLEFHSTSPPILGLEQSGRGFLLHSDAQVAAREISTFSAADGQRYGEFRAFLGRVTPLVRRMLDKAPPDPSDTSLTAHWGLLRDGMALRRLGRKDMMDLLRIGPMSVADWLDEWFDHEALKCLLGAPALWGNFLGPLSPGSAGNLLRREALAGRTIKKGPASLIEALTAAAKAHGAEIRTGAEVARIRLSNGCVTGVTLQGGGQIDSSLVAASCDPKQTLLKLVAGTEVSAKLASQTAGYRTDGVTAKVNLALSAPLTFNGREDLVIEHARTGETWNEMERAFDAIKYGRFSEKPVLDIYVPSISDPSLAPTGHCVVSILVHFAPYNLRGGWNDEQRDRLGDAVVDLLGKHASGLSRNMVAREVLSPADIERKYGVTGGHIYHGHHGLDQLLVRPGPQCARYETPIAGLYLCGSGSHPGGGLTCGPGSLAARTILNAG